MDVQTLNLVGFVSQATFALTMTLLAWSDRRSRGMVWLAGASITQLLATTFRYMVPKDPHHISDAIGNSLVILIFFCAHQGLQWFADRHEQRATWMPVIVGIGVAVSSFTSLVLPALAMDIARIFVVINIVGTMRMLLQPRFRALVVASRLCAVPLAMILILLLFRTAVDLFTTDAMHDAMIGLSREATLVVVPLMLLSFIALFIAENQRRLQEETRTDALTGLNNRRAMEEYAAREIEYAHQHHKPLSLLMLDMDNFKRLNDTWGHWLGDRALHALGSVLLTGTRTTDIAARMGGEEFAVLLPGRDMEGALVVAERIRTAVEDLNLNEAECNASLTVSIGISLLRPGEKNWADMLRRSDKALYRAKREGRNRVVQYTDDVTSIESVDHTQLFRGSGRMMTGTNGHGWDH